MTFKKSFLILTIACLAALTAWPSSAGRVCDALASAVAGGTRAEYKVIVMLEPGTFARSSSQGDGFSRETVEKSLVRLECKVVGAIAAIDSLVAIAPAAAVRSAAGIDGVAAIALDGPVEVPTTFPGRDADAGYEGITFGVSNIGARKVWEQYGITGQGVVIGHIDTGIDGAHPALAGKILRYSDFTDSPGIEPTDTNGHGTHTAATIVGGSESGKAIGVAPGAKLIVAKAIGNTGANLLEAMEWMLDPDGNPATNDSPRAVSCSWHSGNADQEPFYAMIERWIASGIVPCFSAGNSGPSAGTITKPKEHPGTIAIAAVDSVDAIASFSSRGPAMFRGSEVPKPDFAAPGKDVYSAKTGGGYTVKSGTSMACPHAAGVMALLFEANPALSVDDIRSIFKDTVRDFGAQGFDSQFGWGRLDAYSAVTLAFKGGRVSGRVVSAAGNPVGATVIAPAQGIELTTGADGAFKLCLPEGTHVLRASAFGFLSSETRVTVAPGQETQVVFTLSDAPRHMLGGTVTSAATGDGTESTVLLDGHAETAVESDGEGKYALTVPEGIHRVRVKARGYQNWVSEPLDFTGPKVVDAVIEPLPPVLLVDDDAGKDYEKYFADALRASGVAFDTLKTSQGGPAASDLLPYRAVVWLCGTDSNKTFLAPDQAAVEEYLSSGGAILVSGQDIGYDLKDEAFLSKTLGVKYLRDKAKSTNVSGSGISFSISGGDGANNQTYPDVISPAAGFKAILAYAGEDGAAGIADGGFGEPSAPRAESGARVVYLGFGFEGISSSGNRTELMKAVMAHLLPGPVLLARRAFDLVSSEKPSWTEAGRTLDIAAGLSMDLKSADQKTLSEIAALALSRGCASGSAIYARVASIIGGEER